MKWLCSSQFLNTLLATIILCSFIQVDGKRIRHRRQYLSNNFGAYAIDPPVVSYYGSGSGSYTGNSQQNNRFIVGGVAYQYPTPVNVVSGGSYNPQQYNAYPSGSDGYYYPNMNNMRLPSPDGWYSAYYFQGYPFLPFFNSTQRHAEVSIINKLLLMIFTCLLCIRIL